MKTFFGIVIILCLVGVSVWLLYSSTKDIITFVKNKKNKKMEDINDKKV